MTQELKPGEFVRDILMDTVHELEVNDYSAKFPLKLALLGRSIMEDGRDYESHKHPRFIKCDKPKKKVLKKYYFASWKIESDSLDMRRGSTLYDCKTGISYLDDLTKKDFQIHSIEIEVEE